MDFIFEVLLEIIMTPIIEGYVFAMMLFSKKSKKISKQKAICIVVVESIVLLFLFIFGGVILLETSGESFIGKFLFILSIVVSLVQVLVGIILSIVNKKKNSRLK